MGLVEWTAVLGNVGEFPGAIAVVVTLALLVCQMRQNTRAIESQATIGIAQMSPQNAMIAAEGPRVPRRGGAVERRPATQHGSDGPADRFREHLSSVRTRYRYRRLPRIARPQTEAFRFAS